MATKANKNALLSNTANNTIDKVLSDTIKDNGKEHGRTLQLAVAVHDSTLDVSALIEGTSSYMVKHAKTGKESSARAQRRAALIDIAPSFKATVELAKAKSKSIFDTSNAKSEENAVAAAETMFLSACFIALALRAMKPTSLVLSNNNKVLKFQGARMINKEGVLHDVPTIMDNGKPVPAAPTHMSLLLTAGKALARKANLVAPATSGTVTATSPAAAAKSAMESIAATLRDMKPQERVAFADMDDKQGLVQLILAHYGHAGIVELASIERDLRNLANQFHFVVEGTAKAELIKGKKNAA